MERIITIIMLNLCSLIYSFIVGYLTYEKETYRSKYENEIKIREEIINKYEEYVKRINTKR